VVLPLNYTREYININTFSNTGGRGRTDTPEGTRF
jgi:hypothetical protein